MPQDTTVFGPCAAMIHWMLELSSSWSGEKPTDADAFSGTWQWTTSLLYKKVIHAFYTSRAGIRQLTEGFPILSYVPLWNKRMKSPTGNKQAICPGWPGLMILGWVFGGSDQYQVGHTTNPTLVVNDIVYIYIVIISQQCNLSLETWNVPLSCPIPFYCLVRKSSKKQNWARIIPTSGSTQFFILTIPTS